MWRMCKHFQWVDARLTRAEKISVMSLEVENRSLRADVLTTVATLRWYMDAEKGVNILLHEAVKSQVLPICVCVIAFIAYVMLFTGGLM